MTRSSAGGHGNPFVGLRAVPSHVDSPEPPRAQGKGKERPGKIIAIDPGAERTGIAVRYPNMNITEALTMKPWDAVEWFEDMVGHGLPTSAVVFEQWVPYPHAAAANAWRDLVEAKILGAMEWCCRKFEVPYCYQQTSILIPTVANADHRGYKWTARNRDEKAAETHLYYYLNNKEGNK